MAKKRIVNLLYLYMHSKIQKEANGEGIIGRVRVFELFGKLYHIPKRFWYPVLKEMVYLDLVECPNPQNVKVLNSTFDLENLSKIQEKLDFF